MAALTHTNKLKGWQIKSCDTTFPVTEGRVKRSNLRDFPCAILAVVSVNSCVELVCHLAFQ